MYRINFDLIRKKIVNMVMGLMVMHLFSENTVYVYMCLLLSSFLLHLSHNVIQHVLAYAAYNMYYAYNMYMQQRRYWQFSFCLMQPVYAGPKIMTIFGQNFSHRPTSCLSAEIKHAN